MTKDFMETVKSRRSSRQFSDELVSNNVINSVIEAGFYAPSAHNLRPYDIIITKKKNILEEVKNLNEYADFLPQAYGAFFVIGNKDIQKYDEFLIADCAAVTQNMLLALEYYDLGGVWIGVMTNSNLQIQLSKILELNECQRVISIIAFGHKKFVKEKKERFDQSKIHIDKMSK